MSLESPTRGLATPKVPKYTKRRTPYLMIFHRMIYTQNALSTHDIEQLTVDAPHAIRCPVLRRLRCRNRCPLEKILSSVKKGRKTRQTLTRLRIFPAIQNNIPPSFYYTVHPHPFTSPSHMYALLCAAGKAPGINGTSAFLKGVPIADIVTRFDIERNALTTESLDEVHG